MRLALVVAAMLSITLGCGPSGGGDGCKDKLVAGDLVITEVFADFAPPEGGTGADEGKEWFEIYNASDRPIELQGLTVVHSRPDGMKTNSHEMTAVTIAPGQFFTLGNSADDLLPPYVDYGYAADLDGLFNTDGGKLALTCGTTEIDSAVYDGVRSGHSRQLTSAQPPDYTVNDDQANWCEAKDTEFESGNFGTPGEDNDCAPVIVGQCNDNGTMRPAVAPVVGDLVITEVMPQPNGDDGTAEWFELKVLRDVDLNGLGISRPSTTTGASVVESPDCIRVTAGSYAVLAKSLDPALNDGLPLATIVATFKSTLSLVNGSAGTPADLQIVMGGTVLDAITWTRSTAKASVSLDPDLSDAISNDSPSNFCDGTLVYDVTSDNKGTPGAENGQCTLLPPAGQCDGGSGNRAIVKPAAGELVITEFLANPAAPPVAGTTDATKEWFEITNTGAAAFDLNELGIIGTGVTPAVIRSGTCLSIAPGGVGLFARSSDPLLNGGLPAVDVTFSFGLVDTTGKIQIFDGATLLDAVTWPSVTSGISKQLDPDLLTTTDNDVPTNFCPGTTAYGDLTNQGTPKAANAQCP